jgi:hypothetical protein
MTGHPIGTHCLVVGTDDVMGERFIGTEVEVISEPGIHPCGCPAHRSMQAVESALVRQLLHELRCRGVAALQVIFRPEHLLPIDPSREVIDERGREVAA